ncbi:MAG: hypothetical protein IJW54_00700 [Clostridia bacterium]|nr:hypothetical protein [Clostridia bacterium]
MIKNSTKFSLFFIAVIATRHVCQFMRSYEIYEKPKSKSMQGFDKI